MKIRCRRGEGGWLKKREAMKAGKCRNLAIFLNQMIRNDIVLQRRFLQEGPDTVEELLERHIVKKGNSYDDEEDEILTRRRLTSTRREALSLYRDILRATRFFMWPDSRGVLWRDVLRENARKEFEEARFEKDPEIITRLLIGGRDAVQSALDKLVEKQKELVEKERRDRDRRWFWVTSLFFKCMCTIGIINLNIIIGILLWRWNGFGKPWWFVW